MYIHCGGNVGVLGFFPLWQAADVIVGVLGFFPLQHDYQAADVIVGVLGFIPLDYQAADIIEHQGSAGKPVSTFKQLILSYGWS